MNRILKKLAQIEDDVTRKCLSEGCDVERVKCNILYERTDYYFVVLRNYYNRDLWIMKFRLMKKDLSIIWSESWL